MKTLWLPGAGASSNFWRAAAERVEGEHLFFSWPGLGNEPASPGINSIADLVQIVRSEMRALVNIVAQSLGGYIAVKAALEAPHKVSRLVLAATSAGLPMERFGAVDWRQMYFESYPDAASWVAEPVEDLSGALPSLEMPILLLSGDRDRISPVAVGKELEQSLPNAQLNIIPGGDHDFAATHASLVGGFIADHFAGFEAPGPIG